jgi:AcrR family transcriptional regulator
MARAVASAERERRSNAERRETTRTALLDAAVDSLVEEGYANTTTRGIAERAGVTPGALHHYFSTKAKLLGETRHHISAKIIVAVRGPGAPDALPLPQRAEAQMDRMWELYKGPLFQAAMELWVAARTDAELRRELSEWQRDGASWVRAGSASAYPELADRPGLPALIATGEATLRGLAILRFISDEDAEKLWPATRSYLLALMAGFSAEAQSQ